MVGCAVVPAGDDPNDGPDRPPRPAVRGNAEDVEDGGAEPFLKRGDKINLTSKSEPWGPREVETETRAGMLRLDRDDALLSFEKDDR